VELDMQVATLMLVVPRSTVHYERRVLVLMNAMTDYAIMSLSSY
jgi:hypothetical protein